MASIIAGRDDAATTTAAFTKPGTFVGIAPNAGIVNVKVGSASGAVDVSQVIAGIDWVVQNAKSGGLNIKVLNLSFGTNSVQPYTLDPLDYAAEVAWRQGIVVVASAGNDGKSTTTLEDPADDPFVISVGAEDTDTAGVLQGPSVASFTNTGNPDRTVDVLAPGVHVLGLRDPGSLIDQTFPSAEVGTRFFRGSGTSQATAVVSGAMALLAQQYPSATPDELKYLLDSTAIPLKGVATLSQGNGAIQVGRAATDLQWPLIKAFGALPKAPAVLPLQLGNSLLIPNQVVQPWVASTGTGSLDGARGGDYLTNPNGQALQGQEDVWGGAFNSSIVASAEAKGTTWTAAGSTWNGKQLLGTGAVATLWDGTAVGGVESENMRWSNMRWSGGGWDNMRWSDASWDNMRWSGDGWD
jgi:serine protease AprX